MHAIFPLLSGRVQIAAVIAAENDQLQDAETAAQCKAACLEVSQSFGAVQLRQHNADRRGVVASAELLLPPTAMHSIAQQAVWRLTGEAPKEFRS